MYWLPHPPAHQFPLSLIRPAVYNWTMNTPSLPDYQCCTCLCFPAIWTRACICTWSVPAISVSCSWPAHLLGPTWICITVQTAIMLPTCKSVPDHCLSKFLFILLTCCVCISIALPLFSRIHLPCQQMQRVPFSIKVTNKWNMGVVLDNTCSSAWGRKVLALNWIHYHFQLALWVVMQTCYEEPVKEKSKISGYTQTHTCTQCI